MGFEFGAFAEQNHASHGLTHIGRRTRPRRGHRTNVAHNQHRAVRKRDMAMKKNIMLRLHITVGEVQLPDPPLRRKKTR